jgi:ATP-dependent Clp protease ATP-binding subunit ClpC
MENKFSEGLNNVFKLSKSEAKRLQSEFLSTEHFLLGIIKTDNSAKEILENLQADLTQIRRKIENMNQNTNPFAEEKDSISLTKLADYALKRADLESRQYKSSEINTVHLLLGILYKIEDPATSILGSYDVDYESVAKEYQALLKNSGQLPKSSAYDDDEEREEYGQMKNLQVVFLQEKAKHLR